MRCEYFKTKDGQPVIVCGPSRRGAKRFCKFCRSHYTSDQGKLCDFPVGNGRTCDAEMCSSCARTLGHQDTPVGSTSLMRVNDTIDVCPIHRDQGVVIGRRLMPQP